VIAAARHSGECCQAQNSIGPVEHVRYSELGKVIRPLRESLGQVNEQMVKNLTAKCPMPAMVSG
jgi:hypothetical protein